MDNPLINEKAVIKWMGISFVTLALILGSIEFLGYSWEKNLAEGPMGWTLVASRRLKMEPHETNGVSYYLLEPQKDYEWNGIPVHISSSGFRTPEFSVEKEPGTYRILNVGDSISFGWSVRLEDTYSQVLAKDLNKGGSGAKRVEIINAGVPAWNLDSERNFLLADGFRYQPDLVILDFTLLNDITGGGFTEPEGSSTIQWLRDQTFGWSYLTTNARFIMSNRVGPEAIPVLNPPKNADAYFPLNKDHPAYQRTWDYIFEMYSACEQRGIPFVVVLFPTANQLNSLEHPNTPQQVLTQYAKQNSIPYIDLLPVYQQVCDLSGEGACEGYDNILFADVWMHPNPYGHQIAAEQLLSYVRKSMGSIP